MVLPLLSYTEQSFVLFLLLCLLVGLLGSGLVALVQAVDHIVGNVEPLVGQQDVVALLGEDQTELLVLVIVLEEVLQRVAEGLVELGGLAGELVLQTCLQLLKVTLLTLDGGLLRGGLLAAGETVVVQLLLEVVHGCLQGVTLRGQRVIWSVTL